MSLIRLQLGSGSSMTQVRMTQVSWLASAAAHVLAIGTLCLWPGPQSSQLPRMAGSRSVSSVQLIFSPAANDETPLELEVEILAEVFEPPEEIESLAQPLSENAHATPAEVIETSEYVVLPNADLLDFAAMSITDSTQVEEITSAKPHETTNEVETHHEKQPPKTATSSFSLATAVSTATDVGLDPTSPAKPLHNPPPVYPAEAIVRGVEGRVVLRVVVASSGEVTSLQVAISSGDPALDQAAVDAVGHWKFEPARRDQHAVAWTAFLPVRFRIR